MKRFAKAKHMRTRSQRLRALHRRTEPREEERGRPNKLFSRPPQIVPVRGC